MTAHTSARLPLIATGSVIGVALVLTAPLAASAHVGVSPEVAPAGTRTTLQFSFSHGCDDSPTTALAVDIPDAVTTVTPVVDGEWSITRDIGADGVPTRVVFTADDPIDSGLRASVALDVTFTEGAAGESVAFPVEQSCVVGSTAWNEATGSDDPVARGLAAASLVTGVGALVAALWRRRARS